MNHPKKVLIVEDVDFSRKALISMLTKLNCEVDGAASGHEALEKMADDVYDLILADINLNDMEGMTVAETVRNSGCDYAQDIPIIALTSYDDDFIKEKALSSGINDFLVKPLTFEMAQAVLKKWDIS